MMGKNKETTLDLCRDFRKKPTIAEATLWEVLRTKRLDGYKFRRQHPLQGYIVDFYCPELKLAIEVDGEVHKDEEQLKYDQERTKNLQEFGILIIRFWNSEITDELPIVLERIRTFIGMQK